MGFRENFHRINEWLDGVMQFLDWTFGIAGRAGILAASGLVVYAVFQLFFGAEEPSQTRAGKMLVLLNENWKATLLVVLPLLYLPLRTFLNSFTEIIIAGNKFRRDKYPPDVPDDEVVDTRG